MTASFLKQDPNTFYVASNFFQALDKTKLISGLALHHIFYRFSPFRCNFCSLIKGITPKIRMLCFVLINSVLLNSLYVFGSS